MRAQLHKVAENLYVHCGAVKTGILTHGSSAILIDCGDGDVAASLSKLGISRIDYLLFTHHHRDQASGAARLLQPATKVAVPQHEARWFAAVERYWRNPKNRWGFYNFRPHNLMLAESVPVHIRLKHGDQIAWGQFGITVLRTPGHTDGSVSYLVKTPAQKDYAFSGDLIYDAGQIWEIHSLQKAPAHLLKQKPRLRSVDYAHFMGDLPRLCHSLRRLAARRPTALIPSHGRIMRNPATAVAQLIQRLTQCYQHHAAVNAIRLYLPTWMLPEIPPAGPALALQKQAAPPAFLRHYGTNWLIISASRAAFLVDGIFGGLENIRKAGDIDRVEGRWLSHYHDDHVGMRPPFHTVLDCPTYADACLQDILEHPLAWRLPCLWREPVKVDHPTRDGESWRWREFRMTAYHFPSQTEYHGALLVEGRGMRLLFAGDGLTRWGLTHYLPANRIFLGRGVGYDKSLALLARLKPDWIVPGHDEFVFKYTPAALKLLRENIRKTPEIFAPLFDWDNVNYGIDEHWVRGYPYEQAARAGDRIKLGVRFTNHSAHSCRLRCAPVFPDSWNLKTQAKQACIPPKKEAGLVFPVTIPPGINAGRWIIPFRITYHGRMLGQFRESIVTIPPS